MPPRPFWGANLVFKLLGATTQTFPMAGLAFSRSTLHCKVSSSRFPLFRHARVEDRMDAASPTQPETTKPAPDRDDGWSGAVRWWEWRRVVYNLVLATVFVALLVRTWPRIAPE